MQTASGVTEMNDDVHQLCQRMREHSSKRNSSVPGQDEIIK